MPDDRRIRGDVNAILNRLVRDGVIAGFATNFGERVPAPRHRVQITVVTGTATNPEAARSAVGAALQRFSDKVRVTVKAG